MRWNLDDLFQSFEHLYQVLSLVKQQAVDFEGYYKGKINDRLSDTDLEQIIKVYEGIQTQLYRAHAYADLNHLSHLKDENISKNYNRALEIITDISQHLVFFTLEINMTRKNFTNYYTAWLDKIRMFKDHQLSEELEIFIQAKELTSGSAWIRLYDETLAGIEFDFQGGKCGISNVLEGMSALDKDIRKEAAEALHNGLKHNLKQFAFIYNVLLQDKSIEDKKRHYTSPMHYRHLANQIESEAVDALVDSVKKAYSRLSHRFYRIKAKVMGVEKLQYWDRNAPIFVDEDTKIPYEEAQKIVYDAYNDFSPIFGEIVQKFYDNNWIDVPALDSKMSGAFSYPAPNHPYILLNYEGTIRDVMTLAHELGHGIHQYLSNDLGVLLADTPLTVSETASVFGEMLTFEILRTKTQDPRSIIASKISDMLNTTVRQIAFYEFERKMHEERMNGELSIERLNQCWMEVQKESLGEHVALDPIVESYWSYISHFFHSPFYVYAYAFGDCLVNALFHVYKTAPDQAVFKEHYINLLKAGGSKNYKELLKPFDLNPLSPSFWESGLKTIEDLIIELENLI